MKITNFATTGPTAAGIDTHTISPETSKKMYIWVKKVVAEYTEKINR